MAKGDNIQKRLIEFAVQIIKLTGYLPKNQAGRHISGQLLRSGTSPAPNYGEARGAESKKDFVHKLGLVLKELNESFIWLEILKQSQIIHERKLCDLIGECDELAKIISVSIRNANNGISSKR